MSTPWLSVVKKISGNSVTDYVKFMMLEGDTYAKTTVKVSDAGQYM